MCAWWPAAAAENRSLKSSHNAASGGWRHAASPLVAHQPHTHLPSSSSRAQAGKAMEVTRAIADRGTAGRSSGPDMFDAVKPDALCIR